jgi:L-histidine N-alpha-methyltransferase
MTRDMMERERRARAAAREATATRPSPEGARGVMLADVLDGLTRAEKVLSPKYFYDARGAARFDDITRLPEYYLTRAERRLIAEVIAPWLRQRHPCSLAELGAGSGDKTRLLLDAMPAGATYVPIDIADAYLAQIERELHADYAHLRITPVLADFTQSLTLPPELPRPAVFAFLGSTIGNFDDVSAHALLSRVRRVMHENDRFLLGVDLRKDRRTLEAAYNDAAGVTAEFNLNVLRVLNRELGADFDEGAFRHHAFYDEQLGRIEMHLVATREQTVHIGRNVIQIAAAESIRTEISAKYEQTQVRSMLRAAGMSLEQWISDDGRFAIAIAAASDAPVRTGGV